MNYNSLADTAERTFFDKCKIGTVTRTQNSYGEEVESISWGSEISCGFNWNAGRITYKDSLVILPIEGIVRLPRDTVITIANKLQITSRLGEIKSLVFEVVAEPRLGPTAIVVDVKLWR
jgi:hypothetical protein